MKVIKDDEHCLLLNYFGINGKFYLAVSVMTFFDFNEPHNPLKEQDMWPFVQGELGQDAIFDMAMPKPNGEYVIWGHCFTPGGKSRGASQVYVRIGTLEKTLFVFGNRYWKKAAGIGFSISDPEPFTDMPITYRRAFGGSQFERNPTGMGIAPVILPSGIEGVPLPNIEDPAHLTGSPGDRPQPAGFGPLDYTWPQRAGKLGTYDQKWFQENWPFYPDDINWTYFNVAPEDQQMDRFWDGDEFFRLIGMHPKKSEIESRLPGLHHRFFVNQLSDHRKPDSETNFREILAHIDTVWLFPHAEKGIVISRGSIEIKDDEALDIPHLYIVTEHPGEEAGTIESYHEQFVRSLNRTITPDISAEMEQARKDLADLADTLKDLELQVNDAVDRGLGKLPKSAKTPSQVAIDSLKSMENQKPMLVEAERRMAEMKANFGHLIKIEPGHFTNIQKRLDEASLSVASVRGMVDQFKKQGADTLKAMKDGFESQFGKYDLSKLKGEPVGVDDLADLFKEKPGNPWHISGMLFLEHCRDELRSHPETISALRSLGIRPYTMERSWLGINKKETRFDRKYWGLEPLESGDDTLTIPAGLIIPRFEGPDLKTIMVRPVFEDAGDAPQSLSRLVNRLTLCDRDNPVEGSTQDAMVLSLGETKPVVCADDPLEALFLNQELRGFCTVLAIDDPSLPVGKEAAAIIKNAPQFLVISRPERKSPDLDGWKKICDEAEEILLPRYRSLFEAKKDGFDIWQWITDALRPGLQLPGGSKPKDVDVSIPGSIASLIPAIDVDGLIKKVKTELEAQIKPKLDKMEAMDKKIEGLLAEKLKKEGHNLDEILKRPAPNSIPEGANPYAFAKDMYAKRFAELRQKAQAQKGLTPQIEAQLKECEQSANEILSESAKKYDEGMARLASLDAQTAAGHPEWARKMLANAGIDPDDPAPLKLLTREEVIDRHARGLSLSGKNMAGIDLSNLDLQGANLRRANLQKTKFISSNLTGANLTESISGEADFSKASLKEATMVHGIFIKAKFPGADLSHSDMTESLMSETNMESANLTGATLTRTLLEKAIVKNACFKEAYASQIYLLSADISGADFSGADLTKGVFLKSCLDDANFSKCVLDQAAFLETKARKVNFAGANMHNARILLGAVMTESNFTDTKADRVSFMKSDLSGSDFRGTSIERGLIEGCDLSGSDLSGINAKMARITKSNMSDSNLKGINLFQGSLRKSKLVRTDLTQANLYGAEFYRTGVGETKLDDANLKMTKLYKRTDLIPEAPKEKNRK